MTNWGFDENDNDGLGNDTELNGPKALRDYAAQLKKQNDELNAKLTSFLEEQEATKRATVFKNLGIPGAETVYQGPIDKAEEWATTMKSLFGNQGGTPNVADETVADEPTLPASMQAQFQRMTEAGNQGTPTGNMEAAQASIGNATSSADLIAAFDRLNRM